MVDPIWIPIISSVAFFAALVFIVSAIARYRTERAKLEAAGGGEYRKLAEEAVRAQGALLSEIRGMNATLKEIERLLKEV